MAAMAKFPRHPPAPPTHGGSPPRPGPRRGTGGRRPSLTHTHTHAAAATGLLAMPAAGGPPDSGASQAQLARQQQRFVGTMDAGATKERWAANIHRDSAANYVGFHPLGTYMALARGESIGREKFEIVESMYAPLVGRGR